MHTKLQAINYSQWDSLHLKPKVTVGVHASRWGHCIISQAEVSSSENALCGLSFQNLTHSEALHAASITWPESEVHYDEQATVHWISIAENYLTGITPGEEHTLLLRGTPFQLTVWAALLNIPTAQVLSYQDIANKIGQPKAVRAVGTAIGKNKISLLIPCHRVVRSSGDLGGYAWGLAIKQSLLDYEAHLSK